jgi:hypothetical protein
METFQRLGPSKSLIVVFGSFALIVIAAITIWFAVQVISQYSVWQQQVSTAERTYERGASKLGDILIFPEGWEPVMATNAWEWFVCKKGDEYRRCTPRVIVNPQADQAIDNN